MKSGSATRRLGSFERAQILTGERFPYNLVAVLGLEGFPADERVRSALDEVQRLHPLLRARLGRENGNTVFRLGDTGPLPLRRVVAESWKTAVEDELATGFDVERGPLARCLCVVPAEDGEEATGELVLTLHHAIADGDGVGRLAADLLALVAGDSVSGAAGQALPPAADERFPDRHRGLAAWPASLRFLARQGVDELSFRWRRRRRPAVPRPGPARCRVLTAALSVEDTAALVRASRRQRVSLTAALEAAMLLAVSRQRYGGERLPLRYFTFPLLRPYLQPPVGEGVFGSYLTTMRFTIEVGGEDGLWPLATAISSQIYEAVKRGEKFLSSRWSPLSIRMMLGRSGQRMSTTALSYTGPTTLEAEPAAGGDRPRVRELHAFVSNFPPGPEFTAQARIYRRRLVWDVVYLDVDMSHEEALAITEEMRRLVAPVAAPSGSVP